MYISCKNLTFRFLEKEDYVFKDLNFHMTGPGFHALFGHSGTGKSTFAKILSSNHFSFSHEISGNISINPIRKPMYSYNQERFPKWQTIRTHFNQVIAKSYLEKVDELVQSFGLHLCYDSRFDQLSQGQQNRANLIRYLLQDFDMMILDESLANVDEKNRLQIILHIKKIFPQRMFIYISHNVREIAYYCDQIAILRDVNNTPQLILLKGHNAFETPVPQDELERTMLEIVHAS